MMLYPSMAIITIDLDTFNISREEQDAYAIESYNRANAAWSNGKFDAEVAPITVKGKRGKTDSIVSIDEEYTNIKLDKIPTLRPAFKKDGSVTGMFFSPSCLCGASLTMPCDDDDDDDDDEYTNLCNVCFLLFLFIYSSFSISSLLSMISLLFGSALY